MTLQFQFEQELAKLSTSGARALNVSEPPRRLKCDLVECNALAVSFTVLRLTSTELYDATVQDLERIAKAIAARLTYLMEPINPIEIDAEACVVQLRSTPPQQADDGRSYYELIVRRGGELALLRYRKENGAPREPIAATVTREVLLRLVGDFCAVLDGTK